MTYSNLELDRIWGSIVTGFDFVIDPMHPHVGLKAVVLMDLPSVQSMMLMGESGDEMFDRMSSGEHREIYVRELSVGGRWGNWRLATSGVATIAPRKTVEMRPTV